MNSTIRFNDAKLFNAALTVLEMTNTPGYVSDSNELTIASEAIDTIANILNSENIFLFDVAGDELTDEEKDMHDDRDYNDDMDGDHASALASAGFGTDEDYGMAAYDDRCDCGE